MMPRPEFKVGQVVKCKALTSMAAQLLGSLGKLKVGETYVVEMTAPQTDGMLLCVSKDQVPLYRTAQLPSKDFESVDGTANIPA